MQNQRLLGEKEIIHVEPLLNGNEEYFENFETLKEALPP
jgi:hypothetical protein